MRPESLQKFALRHFDGKDAHGDVAATIRGRDLQSERSFSVSGPPSNRPGLAVADPGRREVHTVNTRRQADDSIRAICEQLPLAINRVRELQNPLGRGIV